MAASWRAVSRQTMTIAAIAATTNRSAASAAHRSAPAASDRTRRTSRGPARHRSGWRIHATRSTTVASPNGTAHQTTSPVPAPGRCWGPTGT